MASANLRHFTTYKKRHFRNYKKTKKRFPAKGESFQFYCQGGDSDPRPKAYESSALPLSYPGEIIRSLVCGNLSVCQGLSRKIFKEHRRNSLGIPPDFSRLYLAISTETFLCAPSHFTIPSTNENKVKSLPIPTFSPARTFVPHWRTIILPAKTYSPPNFLTPLRCELESRPFFAAPCPFLCAIKNRLS